MAVTRKRFSKLHLHSNNNLYACAYDVLSNSDTVLVCHIQTEKIQYSTGIGRYQKGIY